MSSLQFQKLYKGLNQQQKKAVDTIEGPVMVIAGPGTGKTQILTLRIANILLKTQVNPENILALTFSEAASFEMRNRLSKIIGTSAFRVEVSTFHSFTNDIIKNYPDEFHQLLSFDSITEVEQLELIEKLINSLKLKLLRPFGDPLYYLKHILNAINDLKKEGIGVEKFKKALKKQKGDFEKIDDLFHDKGPYKGVMKGKYQDLEKNIGKLDEFLRVFGAYQKSLQELKKYDFNDMLLGVVKVLEKNKYLLLNIQEKYQYILIDEHQDTNAAQNRLIELIANFFELPNLFVVGDEKQAIYRFQGASLENFLYFKSLYPQAEMISLQKNYRSQQMILDASQSLIEKNIGASILERINLQSDGLFKKKKVEISMLPDFHHEYEYVASSIEQKLKGGFSSSEIAVLARRNIDLIPLTQRLNRRGIKFTIQADLDILSDIQIQKLIILLEAIEYKFDEPYFIKALHIDFLKVEPFDLYKLFNYAKEQKLTIFSVLSKDIRKLIKPLELEKLEAITSFYLKYIKWIKQNRNLPLDDLFVNVINESGLLEQCLKSPERYQIINKLTGLFDEIKLQLYKNPQFNLEDFLKLLETVKKYQLTLKSKPDNTLEDGVRLLTVHKSKGLEFDWVYIINCFEGRWGNRKRRGGGINIPWTYLGKNIKVDVSFDEIEDERRLFYVGLTRARQGVTLSYARTGLDGREQLPSQFLQEIDQKYINQVEVADDKSVIDQQTIFDVSQKNDLSAKNKKYLQSLFLEKGLSATGLDNFLECPWQYFFRNLVSLPDKKNKFLIFGTDIHQALDSFIKHKKNNKVGVQFLIKQFNEALSKEALSKNDREDLSSKGIKALKAFYNEVVINWPSDIRSEVAVRGVKFSDQLTLNGKIDMIEQLSIGGAVRVHDFKTGGVKTRSQIDGSKVDSKSNYLRQLVFYKLLLDRYKDGLFKMTEGVIDFVEPDDKGRIHSEVFDITDQQVKELEKMLILVGDQIINLDFWDKHCNNKDCKYCHLRELTFKN